MPTDPATTPAPRGDEGLSLLEVLMSIFVIGTVMASVAPFLVRSLNVSDQQRGEQIAVQVANDALERVRGIDPTSLLTGRGAAETQLQWSKAPAEVKDLLPTGLDSDPMLAATSTAGLRAPLPTRANPVALNGMTFDQQWYVGRCWQPKADATHTVIGSCGATVTAVPYFRVVVSVTWSHRSCPAQSCIYVASTLVSTGTDPVFDTKRPAPTVTDPGTQYAYVAVPVDLQIASTGGRLPLTWSVTGLPPGLTMSATAQITGTPTTTGTYSVTVKVTDKDGRTDDATFSWIVSNDLILTNPGDRTSPLSTAVSLAMVASGGRPTLSWSAAGLPTGLTINATTGVISGTTPATNQVANVTVTVKDSGTREVTVAFVWRIAPPLTVADPGPRTATIGDTFTYSPSASGGSPPYSWQASDLPDGLSIDPSTGQITGTVLLGTRYIVTVTVTDSGGTQATVPMVISVTMTNASDLRVTAPNPANPNRTTAVGTAVSFTADASGANKPTHAWSAKNLPPGMTITADGLVSGKPTTKGAYRVSLIVTSDLSSATLMFDWTVT